MGEFDELLKLLPVGKAVVGNSGKTHRCSRCMEVKPIEEFDMRGGQRGDKPQAYCKTCKNKYNGAYRKDQRMGKRK